MYIAMLLLLRIVIFFKKKFKDVKMKEKSVKLLTAFNFTFFHPWKQASKFLL